MQYYQCKCGKQQYWGSGVSPKNCEGCEECNTTFSQTTTGHKPLSPHKWVIKFSDNGKPYKMCKDCYKKERYDFPEKVCLCGSTRFYDAFQKANYELTMQGKIVLSVGFYMHSQEQAHGQNVGCTPEQKVALDELHKRKIDLCDRVLVLNVGGYIGESTRSEIEYAEKIGKPVDYLEHHQVQPEMDCTKRRDEWPERSPHTGLPFFMAIEHPDLGVVPTYGGPFNSYTIPQKDDDGEYIYYKYDHDEGCWDTDVFIFSYGEDD